MQRVVKEATDQADKRACNVKMFGLIETAVEEKPYFEVLRIGKVRQGVARPVLIKLRSGAVAAG